MKLADNKRDEVNQRVAECWDRAQAHWSRFLLLSDPIDDPKQLAIAQINLGTRQVSLRFGELASKGLLDCVEALLAHEIGHHVRFPGTLAVEARLRLLEKSLVPVENYSTLNPFEDLLINERLGPVYHEQFVRLYQSFDASAQWERDPAFLFYLSIYEELWRLTPGTLLGNALSAFDRAYPGYRADAQLLAQNLFGLGPNIYTQFLYFASVISRYLKPLRGRKLVSRDRNQCGRGDPSDDDWADALTPNAREAEAIRRALEEGWLSEQEAGRMTGDSGLESRIQGLPGQGTKDAARVPEVMAAYYRQQAERFLFRPPPQRTLGEAIVPTTLDEWEPGDPVRDIDWMSTLLQRGEALGIAQPLQRVKIAELEGHDVPLWQPRVEIYLDVSGSMPDPRTTRNAMTLAAMVLTVGAIRAGGSVRLLLYSGEPVAYWQWCRSETELSRFLMHYIGGGTCFPFGILAESTRECGGRPPIRVVITDTDFDHNYAEKPGNARVFAEAVRRSAQFVLLLHRPNDKAVAPYRAAGAHIVAVEELAAFPQMAAGLARALSRSNPVAIADWFRKQPRNRMRVQIDLEPLESALATAIPRLESTEAEPDLVRARLADAYRDAEIDPLAPAAFDGLVVGLDGEAWRRLSLAISALDFRPFREAVPQLATEGGVARQVKDGFVGLARATPLLTMDLLRQSPLRIEEFARQFLARLGLVVAGETAKQSCDRLERLDYARLLAEADRAKLSAEDRMEYLRKLQEKKDQRSPRRGKW